MIGMPGGGKTTVGRLVADRLGLPFSDCDEAVTGRTARSVAEIFAAEGEAAFRDIESQVLADLCATGPSVVATGGGCVVSAANRAILKDRTFCVLLDASPEHLLRRLHGDTSRPLITGAGALQRLQALWRDRETLYRETAAVTIDAVSRRPEFVADDIVACLDRHGYSAADAARHSAS